MCIDLSDDYIDVRDITDRVDELREERDDHDHDDDGNRTGLNWETDCADDADELAELESILSDLCGEGGDHQWEGDWYPVTLIADSAFEDYAQQLAEDIGAIDHGASWPHRYIDWKQAAHELKQDYSYITIGDEDYWFRQ